MFNYVICIYNYYFNIFGYSFGSRFHSDYFGYRNIKTIQIFKDLGRFLFGFSITVFLQGLLISLLSFDNPITQKY